MSHWIASVISSSPRADGSIARTASWIAGAKRYTPTSARSDGGSAGFSTRRTIVAVHVELGDAELPRVVDVREQDLRGRRLGRPRRARVAGRAPREAVDEGPQVLLEHVVAEVHDEVVVAEEVAGDEHAVREAERRVLRGCR